ncbi:hypothetical protein HPP92_007519 [Vanilla planifolia]|uniref:Uncharacterized protein n=1 Tax=Vanilla planifolia TaxID=51239 RepID=A0A835V8S8_VANPL|nr:hypothetical protein HPP92_007519 [Vanilla planifolia]
MNLVPQSKERVYGEDVRMYEFMRTMRNPTSISLPLFTELHSRLCIYCRLLWGTNSCRTSEPYHVAEWLQEDDASSADSGKYSTINYSSGNEQEYCDLSNNQNKAVS